MADDDDGVDPTEQMQRARQRLSEADEVAQVVLTAHLEIEAEVDDALKVLFPHEDVLKEARLTAHQKMTILRAHITTKATGEAIAWPLLFGLNSLRNEIAHGKKTKKRDVKIQALRNGLRGKGKKRFRQAVDSADDIGIITIAAEVASGFVILLTKAMKGK